MARSVRLLPHRLDSRWLGEVAALVDLSRAIVSPRVECARVAVCLTPSIQSRSAGDPHVRLPEGVRRPFPGVRQPSWPTAPRRSLRGHPAE